MYKIKPDVIEQIKEYGTVRRIAEATGLSESYVSQVLNGKKSVKNKVCAYAITKTIGSQKEIEDIFEIL